MGDAEEFKARAGGPVALSLIHGHYWSQITEAKARTWGQIFDRKTFRHKCGQEPVIRGQPREKDQGSGEAEEMAHWLKALVAPAEGPGSGPRALMVAHNHL